MQATLERPAAERHTQSTEFAEPDRSHKPRSLYAKATVREQALRIDFIVSMIERKVRPEQMQTAFMDRYQASASIWRASYREALDSMVARLSRPREEYRVEALATLESFIRDPKVPALAKIRSQQVINKLLGLDEGGGTGEGRVMPVIEVIVNNHGEAVEFNRIRDSLEIQSKRITENRTESLIPAAARIVDDSVKAKLINW